MPLAALRSVLPVVHEAALDPRRWQAVCDTLHKATGGVHSHLIFFDAQNPGAVPLLTSGYDPELIRRFKDYYGEINPWRSGMMQFDPMQALTSEELLPHRDLLRTEFHADWLLPQEDISAGAGMVLERTARRLLVVGGHVRMRDQDRMEQPWKQLLDLLGPSLRHAVEVNRVLADLRLQNGLLQLGLSGSSASVLILSQTRSILFANEAAEQDLLTGQTLRRDLRRRLWLTDTLAQEALDAALRRPQHGAAPLALTLTNPLTRARRVAHLLRLGPEVLPFAGIEPVLRQIPDSVAVLVVPALPQLDGLAQAFGLTPTETDIALALHDGQTLGEIAAARGTSLHTVRAQTKAILSKCNVRRQAELVALVARLISQKPGGPS